MTILSLGDGGVMSLLSCSSRPPVLFESPVGFPPVDTRILFSDLIRQFPEHPRDGSSHLLRFPYQPSGHDGFTIGASSRSSRRESGSHIHFDTLAPESFGAPRPALTCKKKGRLLKQGITELTSGMQPSGRLSF